jgi:hypothetical protein
MLQEADYGGPQRGVLSDQLVAHAIFWSVNRPRRLSTELMQPMSHVSIREFVRRKQAVGPHPSRSRGE